MQIVNSFPFFSILFAMIAAIVTPLFKDGKKARLLHLFVTGLAGVFSMALVMQFWGSSETVVYYMGHYPAPWGNELRFGLFESMMAFLFSGVMFLSVLCGTKDIQCDVKPAKQGLYYIMLNLLFSSMLALIYTNDIFTAYVFIEINTIAACAIVMVKESGETLRATLRYLVMSLLGSGLFLISVSILYAITGHLLMAPMLEQITILSAKGTFAVPLMVSAMMITVGLCVKSALFPFHTWLPDAHGSATTSSSSILSGLVVKGYIILLIKIYYRVFGIEVIRAMGIENILFAFGLAGMLAGSINAFRENNIKRMIAYSSVAQIGYIFMGIGLGTQVGLTAAFFHLIAHAFTKPLIFASAGGLSNTANHSKMIADLRGTGRRNPLAGIGFAVGALSMIGMPLFAGFPAKIYLSQAAMYSSEKMVLSMLVLALSTFLNALYYLPVLISIFADDKKKTAPKTSAGIAYTLPIVCYIAANIVIGLFGENILSAIAAGFLPL